MSYFILSLFLLIPPVADVYSSPPHFAFIYDSPKWILLYSFSSLCLLISLFKQKKILIEYPSFIQIPLLLYFFGIFLVLLTAPAGNRETVLLEYLLFFVLSYLFYWALRVDKSFFEKLSVLAFGGVTFLSISVFFTRVAMGKRLLPYFGSPTMYGEYLGALLVTASFFVFFYKNSKILLSVKLALLLLGFVAMVIIQPRAPILGLISVWAFMLMHKKSLFKVNRKIVLASFILLSVFIGFYSFNSQKVESANIRKIRWVNTVDMILAKPLGHGLGNYAASYGEFQNSRAFDVEADEYSIIGNPHNAYLELASENGLISFFAFLVILFLSTRSLLGVSSPYAVLSLSFLIYWSVDAFFNFPQDGPESYLFFAFTGGLVMFFCRDKKIELGVFSSYALRIVALLILMGVPFRIFYSELRSYKNMGKLEVVSKACSFDPQNWRACLRTVSLEWARGNREEALNYLQALEARFPEFYPIKKKIIQILFETGYSEKACEQLRIFDKRFNNASSMHKVLLEKCS